MKRQTSCVIGLSLLSVAAAAPPADWPCFRGPSRQGVATANAVPIQWDKPAWSVTVPGGGWSSPIVSKGRVILTTATDAGRSCRVLAYEAASGKLLWEREVFRIQPGNKEAKNSYATPTAVADAQRIYTVFGDGSFAALDYDGKTGPMTRTTRNWAGKSHGTAPSSSPSMPAPAGSDGRPDAAPPASLMYLPHCSATASSARPATWSRPWTPPPDACCGVPPATAKAWCRRWSPAAV